MILSSNKMNSKIIYVVTPTTSNVVPHKVCSPVCNKDDSSSVTLAPNSFVAQPSQSPSESQVSSSTYDDSALTSPACFHNVPPENSSSAMREFKAEEKFVPEVSIARISNQRIHGNELVASNFEALEGKEDLQHDIVLENTDHSAPEIFTIGNCGSEFYLPDGVKLIGSKEQRIQNYKGDGPSRTSIVELSIIPDDGLWTCLYCGLSMQSSEDQIRSHIDWYCNSKRSLHNSNHEVSRSASPDIDVKTAVDPSQISAISFVPNCNSYDNSCGEQISCAAGLNTSSSSYRCPVCDEEVSALRDHLSQHEKEELVNVIMKTALNYRRVANFDDEVSIVQESVDGAAAAEPSLLGSDILQPSDRPTADDPTHLSSIPQIEELNLPLPLEMKSKRTLSTKIKSSCKKPQAQKVGHGENIVPSKNVQSNVVSRHVINSKKSYRQWSSRAPHPCPVCGKVLSSRGNLSKHLLQHSSAKPWNCSTCGLGFNSHRDWDYHQLQYHSLDRPHVCPVCSKSFAVLANLKEHVIFHGQKTKTCDICGKMFWTSKCVSRHKKRHFTDKKYSCSLCSKEFAIKWDYSLHYKKVHGTD